MTSLKSINRRVGSLFTVAALVLATVTPGLVPSFASAAQVTERSVELSSSSKATPGVAYKVSFTGVSEAKAVVLDFCQNSPLIGSTCNAPAGFSVSAATVSGGFTKATGGTANDANTYVVTGSVDGATEINLANVTNPTAAGPLYVRIVTYDGADTAAAQTAATAYSSTALGSGVVDQGSAAASITDTIGVSGAVLESMTFCVAGEQIPTEGCADVDELDAPSVKLGKTNGDVTALDASEVSEGSIYSQISTNAVSGAVISLKSSALGCGGLLRMGATDPEECNIAPALNTGITLGQAKFGVKVGATATNPSGGQAGNSNGNIRAAAGSIYSSSAFALNYVDENASGITGPFGDPFLDTEGAPVSNKNMQITFGASVANNTPAGLYSTDLSLIATGKF